MLVNFFYRTDEGLLWLLGSKHALLIEGGVKRKHPRGDLVGSEFLDMQEICHGFDCW